MHPKIEEFIQKFSPKRRKKTHFSSPVLNNCKKSQFKRRKKQLNFDFACCQKLKIFGNNIAHYYAALWFIFIIWCIFLIYGPVFTVKTINILKQDNITNLSISYDSIAEIRGKKIFQIEKSDIFSRLNSYQNNITDIKFEISLPDSIKITTITSPALFNTMIHDKSYILTKNWTVVPKNPDETLRNIELIKDFSKIWFIDYKKILKESALTKISEIIYDIEENILDIKIKNIQYRPSIREVHLVLEDNSLLIFSLDEDKDEQVKKLVIFHKDQQNINDAALIYMDLRIKNKIFYCDKTKEYSCKQNLKKIYLSK